MAQTTIRGTVLDESTGETLIGASVMYSPTQGTITDFDGNFALSLPNGQHTLTVAYVGYASKTVAVQANGSPINLSIKLESEILDEVVIVADVALARRTPVAFTNVLPTKIQEELAGQDLPMILNSTPGVYATQQGGGDGDARVNIRGFNQRNVAVMLDGIPVNDMENGWVYWSNWFGLDAVTRTMQVQRGLGASKLALPSVGGTMNIITKGIEAQRSANAMQFVGSDGYLRTAVGLTSGQLPNGFGITFAGSYKRGDGWADQTWTEGWFYFLRVDKRVGQHLFTASAMGAPQSHGQRSFTQPIAELDKEYAAGLADRYDSADVNFIDTTGYTDRGPRYNQHWGWLNRWTLDENGDTIWGEREAVNERENFYHKPLFSLKHSWSTEDGRFFLSNILYSSFGDGGGTGLNESVNQVDGLVDFQLIYDNNISNRFTPGRAGNVRVASMNNHSWYGYLGTLTAKLNESLTLSGGIDARTYRGQHYRVIHDMLGGEFFYDLRNPPITNHNDYNREKRLGDIISYNNDGLVRWGGGFGQVEYASERFSAFFNASAARSSYQRIDYFAPKVIELADTTFTVGLVTAVQDGKTVFVDQEVEYNGVTYTRNSPEAEINQTDWQHFWGYTFKGGANFNLNEHINFFANAGYLSRAPRFNNVFLVSQNRVIQDAKNENVAAVEFGATYGSPKFSTNLNGYYTRWMNKPADRVQSVTIDDRQYSVNINGMNALHMGLELDFVYKPHRMVELNGVVSLGDWTWQSADTAILRDDDGREVGKVGFDAKGVHVGDAAQTQYAANIRLAPFKGFYFRLEGRHFARYFAEFDPFTLQGENSGRDSWQMPAYTLFDLSAGYDFKIGKVYSKVNFNVLNLFDTAYISDAVNNDQYLANNPRTFDAKSATVFMGLGRRYMLTLSARF